MNAKQLKFTGLFLTLVSLSFIGCSTSSILEEVTNNTPSV